MIVRNASVVLKYRFLIFDTDKCFNQLIKKNSSYGGTVFESLGQLKNFNFYLLIFVV